MEIKGMEKLDELVSLNHKLGNVYRMPGDHAFYLLVTCKDMFCFVNLEGGYVCNERYNTLKELDEAGENVDDSLINCYLQVER